MNKIAKIGLNLPLLIGLLLTVTISACEEAKTTADAPNSTNTNGQVATEKQSDNTQNDAQSELRRKQLNADIQAREQRNQMGGDPQKRAEGDLASEVRSKLEANIPRGKLTVEAKNSEVTVSGVVSNQEQLNQIKPLAMEIKGVRSVVVKAVVQP
ncbi:MAG: transporter [Snowella sp.]|jgi:osmotically-inducible protein OsmY|nr:MAG: transporter [Snowella sp.]